MQYKTYEKSHASTMKIDKAADISEHIKDGKTADHMYPGHSAGD